jgi:acyl-CoA thioesterase-1
VTPVAATNAAPVDARLFDHLTDALTNPAGDPKLPRVLLIGDSISIGYTVPVRKYLAGKATVHRPPDNCQHTGYGLEKLGGWLGEGKWNVIHFNWGIWDTHYLDVTSGELVGSNIEMTRPRESIRIRHDLDHYRANLEQLVGELKQTGGRLIWASSTPILFRTGERFKDLERYNAVAASVMKKNNIAIDDLYALSLPNATTWQSDDRCHFAPMGNEKLGQAVGEAILRELLTD